MMQRCPTCGNPFMGSDAIGESCFECQTGILIPSIDGSTSLSSILAPDPEHLSEVDMPFLLSERSILTGFLTTLPQQNVIQRKGFTYRLEQVNAIITSIENLTLTIEPPTTG